MHLRVASKQNGKSLCHACCMVTLAAGLAVASGCGPSGPPKYPVEGNVSFEGQPISSGYISFVPQDSKGRTASTNIENGQFSTEARAGDYKVQIQASQEYGPVIPSMGERARKQYIPRKYNQDTTLSATVQAEDNVFDYELEP